MTFNPIFCFVIAAFLYTTGFCQSQTVIGTVLDTQSQPIGYANVVLMTPQDSTVVKGISTDEVGRFKLVNVAPDRYIIKASYIGYQAATRLITVTETITLEALVLETTMQDLEAINLVYKKPTLTKKADRLVFNIDNTALKEGSILHALKNTPSVLVFGDQIQVKNTTPTVYINNRKVHLSSAELLQLLESSPANTIESIEVITNPSARYDAESGVVLNLVMSKSLVTGYKGNVFSNYTQGVFARYKAGMAHFFKSDKIDFFANYSYNDEKTNVDNSDEVNYLDTHRNLSQSWRSTINRNLWANTHQFNFNIDYTINPKNVLRVASNLLWLPDAKQNILNNTQAYNPQNESLFSFDSKNKAFDSKTNLGFDLDYQLLFRKPGEKLTVNTHFTTFDYAKDQNVLSQYYDNMGQNTGTTNFKTQNNQNTNIVTAQLDYILPINETAFLETGLKNANITTLSDLLHLDIVNGQPVANANNTNAFDYKENIFAAYFNYGYSAEHWNFNFGLRAEQANIKGVSKNNNHTNKQAYLEWFPTFNVGYSINTNWKFYTNYKRSITRPNYSSLDPFKVYINDNTIVRGTPDLKPVITDHATVGVSILELITVEAYYKLLDNNFYEIPRQDNNANILYWEPVNVDKTQDYGFDVLLGWPVTDRWYLYGVTSFYNLTDRANFNGEAVSQSQWSNYSVLQNSFAFLKDRSLNADIALIWVGKNLQGLRIVDNRLVSEFSISKTILKGQGSLSLTAEDLFNTQDYTQTTNYLNQNSSNFYNSDNRTISLGFRYKFGNTKLNTNERQKKHKELDRLKKTN